jgi:glycosyltransferase involved in cell wall biosynthesis
MRILLVSNSGFQYLAPVIPSMEDKGAKFYNLATDDLKVHQKSLAQVKLKVVRQYYFDRSYTAAFRKVIEDFSPDVIHVTGVRSTLLKTLAAVRPFPEIAVVHERISIGGINVLSPLDWALFGHRRITRIVMPSHAMLNQLMGHPVLRRLIKPEICEVLHYGIDLPAPVDAAQRRALRRSLGLDENAFIVGTVCYIRPLKNVEFVAGVVASIASKDPVYFAVVGPENRHRQYMDKIRAAGGERLKLLGPIPNAAKIMPAFDLYVTPTALPGESFGLAFAEAMAHAVPGITMNFGAPGEICEHGVSGYALPPNKAAWRATIEMLMQDRAKCGQLGEAARRRIETHFAPAAVAENYWALYQRAVSEQRAAARRG